ncbi:efflux RND transporter periplasmic adaptor subunit [Morganella psychrotolerans]|nr:efflux RND transporter periplasmic adaptor subunit [Morganella psychrotolerans]
MTVTLILSAASFYCGAETARVSVTHPQITPASDEIVLPGTFVARNEIAVGSPLQQQMVTDVFAEEGQWVEKNQLLATLESPQQSATVRQLQAETEKAAANIRRESTLAQQSQRDLARLTPLARSGVISASEFEKAKSDAQALKALTDAARAELRQLQAQLAREKSQEDKSKIFAPAAGVISERHAVKGMLSDNAMLFKIIENNEIEFEAPVYAADLAQMRAGHEVILKTGQQTALSGKIRYLPAKLSSLTQSGGVRAAITDMPENEFAHPGQTGVMVYTKTPQSRQTLPYSAIRTGKNGERSVFIVNDNKALQHPVQTGRTENGRIEILSPLTKDADVVINAQAFLTNGDTVTPVKAFE